MIARLLTLSLLLIMSLGAQARFLSEDPADGNGNNPPSLHKYLYAYQNPTVNVDPDGRESVSTMLQKAEENADGPWGAFGYRFLSNVYHFSTLGFASIHDPAKDAYDSGKISGKQYAVATSAALVAPAVVIGTGGTASGAVATASTTVGRIGLTSAVGATYGGGLDAYTQGTLIATDVQENYNVRQTVNATAAGAVLAPLAVEGSLAATRTVESVLASRSTSSAKLTIESQSGPSTQTIADVDAGLPYSHPVKAIPKPDYYVNSEGNALPSTFYRYAHSKYAPISNAKSGSLPAKRGGTYVSFDKLDDAIVASDKLQIPYRPDYRVAGDTIDVVDKISIPKGNQGRAEYPEPITQDFKKFGPGGVTQATIEGDVPVNPSTIEKLP